MTSELIELDANLLIGSKTPWKSCEYRGIGAYLTNQIRMGVEQLDNYESSHSAVEDENTAEENLRKKHGDIKDTANSLREGQRNHNRFMRLMENKGIRFKGGPAAAMYRTWVKSDDTTAAFPLPVLEALLPKLKTRVVSGSLKGAPCSFENERTPYWSVADIGPITGAVGQKQFWELVRQTAAELDDYKDGKFNIYHQVTCAVTRLSDPANAPETILKAHTALRLYIPNGISGEVPTVTLIPQTEDFLCLPEKPDQPIIKDYDHFLRTHSTRRKIMDQFVDLVQREEENIPKASNVIKFQAAARKAIERQKVRKPIIVCPTITHGPHRHFENFAIKQKIALPTVDPRSFVHAQSMDFDLGGTIKHADAYVYFPFNPKDEVARAYNYLMLRNNFVARATDRRHHPGAMVILNLNGCYDEAIQSHIAYANSGLNKEFARAAVHDRLPIGQKIITPQTVDHTPLFFCDVLSGGNYGDLLVAGDEALQFRLNGYHRINTKTVGSKFGGVERPDDLFSAVVYASACSDTLQAYQNGVIVGETLADLNAGLTTGGGDQHLMYAAIEGYNNKRRKGLSHLTCVSTHEIVKVETEKGMPPCDYWELHDPIGPRLVTLEKNHLFISIGGGDGTGQETGNILLKKILLPELYKDKQMIFIGKDPSMLLEISSIIGKENLRELLSNPYALKEKGIFLFPDAQSAVPQIKAAHKAFYSKRPLYMPGQALHIVKVA